jgi:1-aminocyclopropane-1-carboxylate deaminase
MVALPSPFSEISREKLLYNHSSPIETLLRLSAELANVNDSSGSHTNYWIKREDSNSGLACGGNKIRKLEYVFPDVLAKGASVVVTTGGLQSNHMRQVAAAAARYGLKVRIFPFKRSFKVYYLVMTTTDASCPQRQSQINGR